MLTPPRRIELIDRTTQPPTPVAAEVVRDFPDAALAVVESAWAPERARLPAGVEHTHWDWVRKVGLPVFEFVAVVVNAQAEGLAAVTRSPVASKLAVGAQASYLMFIETAPWNLPEHPDGGRFGGVGSSLLEEVVLGSVAAGLDGRVLLSALPQAEEFYRKSGMTELGPESPGGLVYFEYTEVQAASFLTKRGLMP
jgi:hypothetical protein